MSQIIRLLGRAGGATIASYGLTTMLGLTAGASLPPIVRPPSGSQAAPQLPACFIEMPNQGRQDLAALCGMGKPKPRRNIDLATDRDRDGVPDELAAEFRKVDALMNSRAPSQAERMAQMRQAMQAMQDMSERLPYAEATKAAMREGVKIFTSDGFGMGNPANSRSSFERLDQLSRQMQQDPAYRQVEQYRNRFMELKYQSR